MTRDGMLRKIDEAEEFLSAEGARARAANIACSDFDGFAEALRWLRREVEARWPLPDHVSGELQRIGVAVVRQLDDDFPDLSVRLIGVFGLADRTSRGGPPHGPTSCFGVWRAAP